MALDRARDTLGQRPWGCSSGKASALDEAGKTLVRASTFLRAARCPRDVPARSRAYLACNALRELDRFLNVLIDEAAATLDAKGFDRLRNVPNKLRAVHDLLDLPSPGHERLRAIGRVRECLHQRGGEMRGEAIWQDLTLAIGAAADARIRRRWLALDLHDLTPICLLYEAIAVGLVAAVRRGRPQQ